MMNSHRFMLRFPCPQDHVMAEAYHFATGHRARNGTIARSALIGTIDWPKGDRVPAPAIIDNNRLVVERNYKCSPHHGHVKRVGRQPRRGNRRRCSTVSIATTRAVRIQEY